jgi:hypothetical protein
MHRQAGLESGAKAARGRLRAAGCRSARVDGITGEELPAMDDQLARVRSPIAPLSARRVRQAVAERVLLVPEIDARQQPYKQ